MFSSKVAKNDKNTTVTSLLDFYGQKHNSIANKLENYLKKSEDLEKKTIPFNDSSQKGWNIKP